MYENVFQKNYIVVELYKHITKSSFKSWKLIICLSSKTEPCEFWCLEKILQYAFLQKFVLASSKTIYSSIIITLYKRTRLFHVLNFWRHCWNCLRFFFTQNCTKYFIECLHVVKFLHFFCLRTGSGSNIIHKCYVFRRSIPSALPWIRYCGYILVQFVCWLEMPRKFIQIIMRKFKKKSVYIRFKTAINAQWTFIRI